MRLATRGNEDLFVGFWIPGFGFGFGALHFEDTEIPNFNSAFLILACHDLPNDGENGIYRFRDLLRLFSKFFRSLLDDILFNISLHDSTWFGGGREVVILL